MAQQDKGEIWFYEETSKRTRVPVSTLRYWRHTGVGGPKSFKIGTRVAYRSLDVEQWLDEQYAAENQVSA